MSPIRTAAVLILTVSCQKATPESAATETATGAALSHAGQPFGDSPAVDISALLADPAAYQGKTVRVNGGVIAMCHHKRDWFALAPRETRDAHVRVLTGPVFKVPEDAIGKRASAEGSVDVVEISERVAKHFAETHQLGDPAKITGPLQQVVVRATGAEFN